MRDLSDSDEAVVLPLKHEVAMTSVALCQYTHHTHNGKAAMMGDERPLMNAASAARAPEAPPEQENLHDPVLACYPGHG